MFSCHASALHSRLSDLPVPVGDSISAFCFVFTQGRADIAGHVIGCHLNQATRIHDALDDVASLGPGIQHARHVIGRHLTQGKRVQNASDDDDVASNIYLGPILSEEITLDIVIFCGTCGTRPAGKCTVTPPMGIPTPRSGSPPWLEGR